MAVRLNKKSKTKQKQIETKNTPKPARPVCGGHLVATVRTRDGLVEAQIRKILLGYAGERTLKKLQKRGRGVSRAEDTNDQSISLKLSIEMPSKR